MTDQLPLTYDNHALRKWEESIFPKLLSWASGRIELPELKDWRNRTFYDMCLHYFFKQQTLFLSYIWINFIFSFPLWFIAVYWMQFPVLYSRNLTFILYIISAYMLIPNSKFLSSFSPFDSHTFVFYVCVYFCFVNKFICIIFQIPYIIAIIL